MSFETFKFTPEINKAITESGYAEPTPIQKKSIPEILQNKHVLASAQTGTGKTAAFVLPILELLHQDKNKVRGPRVLIVSPTRELANQITDSVRKYARHLNINSATVVGGMSYKLQNKLLSKPLDSLHPNHKGLYCLGVHDEFATTETFALGQDDLLESK